MGEAVELPLSQGFVALVDADDPLEPWRFKWHAKVDHRTAYARRKMGGEAPGYLHRFIMGAPAGVLVDHIDGNGLNNRRANLRFATKAENQAHQSGLRGHNTSGYRGVSWHGQKQRWRATIRHRHLGLFNTPEEAAHAFDAAAIELFGEFHGHLNFGKEHA